MLQPPAQHNAHDPGNGSGSPGVRSALGRSLAALLLLVILLVGAGVVLFGRDALPAVPPSASPTPASAAVVSPAASPQRGQGVSGPPAPSATPTPIFTSTPVPSPTLPPPTFTPTPLPTALPPALLSLRTLDQSVVPARDPYALTARLKLKSADTLPRTTGRAPGDYQVGHTDQFNISDVESRNYYTVTATVREVTAHAYWYVQDDLPVDRPALQRLAQVFEDEIYPTDRALFGSEWTPGVDNDPRITILFTPLRGAGGSFSAADEYTKDVNPYSNEREMFYISTNGGWAGLESTLAHEFQHMIHWHEHPNQDIWLNEGAAVLASALNGYDVQGVDADFMRDPGAQLNGWKPSPAMARPNYGAAFLFLDYMMLHYGGEKVIRALIDAPQPGIEAVNSALASLGYSDRFQQVFENWALANLVDSRSGIAPQYRYSDRDVHVAPEASMSYYPTGHSGQVTQFGTNYIELLPANGAPTSLHVDFSGQKETRVIGAPAHSGESIWWSNRGDLADSTMTRRFDLRGLSSATLDFYAWYDIEQDFDYAYAEVSTDGGTGWDTLKGRYTVGTNPNGTNYGSAYTGRSKDKPGADANGWLHERIDLSRYAGKEVMVRFEYITDDGYNAQGFAVDDISIPELGFADDAESNEGWVGSGFVRVANKLPQSYYLALVRFSATGVDIRPIPLDGQNAASFDVAGLGGAYTRAVLVVAGLTSHNIQPVPYEFSVRPGK